MIDESTKRDIEKISYEILKQSKALDVFPTPIEKILNHSELVIDTSIDLSKIDKSFFEKLKEESFEKLKFLQSGLTKVKGFFDRREKKIYVDLSQSDGRKNFVKLHEIGHGVLTWQSEVILAADNDSTLIESFDDGFEAEANYFASITLFQHDRFITEMNSLPLSISSAMSMSKKFGSSVHSALRNFVIQSRNKCALLVLTPIKGAKGNGALCEKRDLFYSNSFLNEIGELDFPENFGFHWEFMKCYQFKIRFNDKGNITLKTKNNEELNSNFHYFNNGHNIFIFLFPKGEINKSRKKIILQNI
ncbi:ImmA/IrrE family metallo-endopeptidase [Flavobacterium sp. TAB 87]|uniref:ImmA/IrrE family metallo-endopeptidase n=1 Tax=Flavobacterium sp. TAB 87 TaxID=1729581 RepID=UPI00076DA977|nr:ImmA/IrrE family metallo-endopeptidase [Flavobacterium sp. TAB 87]KVV15035.1 hypothetical protein AP058_01593 [Flavobacterium sp. TAB 87]